MLTSLEYFIGVEGMLRVARGANVKRKDGVVNYVRTPFGETIHTTPCFICTNFDMRLWER